ncbi:hypothetical protein [Peribacillus sp. SI8-4]|uniref:hypothetical protein n=1 Tax=Peribacillus sp. SI8-4 TaxID=3048009 RepID=UPI002557B871|nr:hypothetical protein [Peribacillus sp. SI8-4]
MDHALHLKPLNESMKAMETVLASWLGKQGNLIKNLGETGGFRVGEQMLTAI